MKAVILLGTLKEKGISNTQTLTEFAVSYLEKSNISCEVIKLAEHKIIRGTYIQAEVPDDFPAIYEKIRAADILIFATPIWWNNHSSEIQRVIERLDEVFDIINEGKASPLDGKLGGMIITGDSDGAEHVTGNIANFFCSIGISIPAYATLGVIWEGHAKKKKQKKEDILEYYAKKYAKDAEAMAKSFAQLGKNN
ncbi:flavodoxin family protein [Flavobacterium sp. NRK1]|uniref:flavodoxin family protein n=1 Tax=Flavobacterium sp. NRK1 TaxID=2954929 RepID=UPI002093A88B|nr:flavodoxin family protein [Flavobacterium sp. NRK1]MCO6149429.1 flavodoxin family protein [Flavobacterium sp. NRK1]